MDRFGFSASYWAKEKGNTELMALLPPVRKWTKDDICNNMADIWAVHGKPGGKKKKGKKGKKKK